MLAREGRESAWQHFIVKWKPQRSVKELLVVKSENSKKGTLPTRGRTDSTVVRTLIILSF